MKKSILLVLFSGALLATPLGWAQNVPEKKFKVQVTISGDEDVKASLGKLLLEEFGTLKDVDLVSVKPAWTMEVLGVAPRNEKKEPVVFLASVLVTQRFSPEYWNGVYGTLAELVLKRQYEQTDKSKKPFVVDKKKLADLEPAWVGNPSRIALDTATENMGRMHAYYLKGANDLRVLAKEIVANFDKGQLEGKRKK
jgi:hypothetical protein